MDTLQDRLAELADNAPTGGAPAAELWARGKRAHRLRTAAVAATVLVAGAVGTGIGVRLVDGEDGRSDQAPVTTEGLTLPIEYPVGEELPDLGDAPGPLAAIWLAPSAGGGPPEAVGLVAETGTFGTLPITVNYDHADAAGDASGLALSPDGRRVAYVNLLGGLSVRNLVSGANYSPPPDFATRVGFTWIGPAELLGHVAGGSDVDGWLWQPGKPLKLINASTDELPNDAIWFADPGVVGPGTRDIWVADQGGGPRSCSPPIVENHGGRFELPQLCDVLGFLPGGDAVGHSSSDPGTVVTRGFSENPSLVVTAGAPERVALAVDLIAEALESSGGAS